MATYGKWKDDDWVMIVIRIAAIAVAIAALIFILWFERAAFT